MMNSAVSFFAGFPAIIAEKQTVDAGALFADAGMTILIGMTVVFSTLILLTLIFKLFGMVGREKDTPTEKKVKAAPAPKTVATPSKAAAPVVEDGVSDEVVAVIAAAVAAMSGDGKRYAVRRISRTPSVGGRNSWAAAGLASSTMPF